MAAEYETAFAEDAVGVEPTHVLAAVTEFGLRYVIGPPGAAASECEIVAKRPVSRWDRNVCFWNARTWEPAAIHPLVHLSYPSGEAHVDR